ncbi:sensor histidine kinase [Micromonospora sp. NBC_01699]|uniref:sensor histidine kinase n=1 Tax=Micromonospora sp. NBC_01699 TaxID=2975984 RepID=UPI002E2EFE6C|nr:sensor histidine kinase [Micromonospora sp. NBC_01699]
MTRIDAPAGLDRPPGRTGPNTGSRPPTGRWHDLLPTGYAPATLFRDALLAALVVLAEVLLTAAVPAETTADGWPRTLTWSLVCAVPIVLGRSWPAAAVALALTGFTAAVVDGHQPLTAVVAFILLTYATAAGFPLRRAALVATVLWAPILVTALALPAARHQLGVPGGYLLFTNVLIALVCFFGGRTVHARRATIRALEERARVAEENQRSMADQAVADERRRIARELHDVVAHHVSVMSVLATGARRVLARDPAAADEALGSIAETSRTTLRELRRLLDVLRTDAEPAAELAPQPGLAGLESLVDQVREAGLPVSLRVDGVPAPLEPSLALTVFRIVQEALTNALKHAGTATAQVRLTYGVYWLVVEILDTGRGPSLDPNPAGHGLVGMRERVALYGGTLRTGPRPGGGYRVYAKVPMERSGVPSSEETA